VNVVVASLMVAVIVDSSCCDNSSRYSFVAYVVAFVHVVFIVVLRLFVSDIKSLFNSVFYAREDCGGSN
jgi:hypothetical protein